MRCIFYYCWLRIKYQIEINGLFWFYVTFSTKSFISVGSLVILALCDTESVNELLVIGIAGFDLQP